MPRKVSVLTYHKIAPVDPKTTYPGTFVPPTLFRKQLSFLAKRGYAVENLEQAFLSGSTSVRKTVCLTFDDGFEDFYNSAFSELSAHGFPSTVFLVSERIGQTNDWDTKVGDASAPLMSAQQILELAQKGVEFGSHTATHAKLGELDESAQREEIFRSKKQIEDLLGKPCRTFCYPYGSHNQATPGLVKQAGYDLGISTLKGLNTAATDPYLIRRIAIRNDTVMPVFIYKLFRAEKYGK